MARLSPHFDSQEFRSSDGVAMPSRQLHWLRLLCVDFLEPLRAEFGVTRVTSGFRSPRANDRAGGAPKSYHRRIPGRRGAAADVWCDRGHPWEWYEFLEGLQAPGLGLYTTHVHVDNRAGRARW